MQVFLIDRSCLQKLYYLLPDANSSLFFKKVQIFFKFSDFLKELKKCKSSLKKLFTKFENWTFFCFLVLFFSLFWFVENQR